MLQVLVVAFLAIAVGFGLIFLLAFADKQSRKRNAGARSEPSLAKPEFEKACVEILERMKLEIHDIQRTDDDNLDIRAKNPAPLVGGEFFVRCVYLPDAGRIEAAEILEMSNVIVQDRLSKGIFMTNGRFTEDLPGIGELAPIEFLDGARLKEISANLPMV